MDPLSITRSAVSLAASCKQLYLFFKKVRDGDPSVTNLWKQIESLERTVDQIRSVAESGILHVESMRHRKALQRSLKDCQDTLNEVNILLGHPDSGQRSELLQRIWNQFKVGFKTEEIQALQSRVAWNHQALAVSLHTLQLSMASQHTAQIGSVQLKVDELLFTMRQMRLQDGASHDARARASGAKAEVRLDVEPVPALEPRSSEPTSQEFPPAQFRNTVSKSPENLLTGSPASSFAAERQAKDVELLQADQDPQDTVDESLRKFMKIQELRQLALLSVESMDYMLAEKRLIEVLEISQSTYGRFYCWKEETLEILVRLYMSRREWKLAEEHWAPVVSARKLNNGKTHASFQKAATLLMRIYRSTGQRSEAAELIKDLTQRYWTEECDETIDLSLLGYAEASQKVADGDLNRFANYLGGERWEEFKAGIERGGIYGTDGKFSLLHLFCETGSEAAVRQLLEMDIRPTNIDGKDSSGRTAMHIATANGQQTLVEMLLAKQASMEMKNMFGETPLIMAATLNHVSLLRLLIGKGANIEATDGYGYTAIHRAVLERATMAAMTLVSNGARIDAKGNEGRTALHCAASKGYDEVVEFLLKEGANPSAVDGKGRTASTLANNRRIVEILEAHLNLETFPRFPRRLSRRS